jgi:hypothetical protein
LSQKRQFFRWIFRRKYLKNHNIGPRSIIIFFPNVKTLHIASYNGVVNSDVVGLGPGSLNHNIFEVRLNSNF